MPTWVARLPHQVGYPAGGSLAADEWKGLVMVYCPVVVCLHFHQNNLLVHTFFVPDSNGMGQMVSSGHCRSPQEDGELG